MAEQNECVEQESQRTVALLEFGSSKQLTDCSFAAVVIEVDNAFGTLGKDISVLCAGKSPSGSKHTYVLQIWSHKWNSNVSMASNDRVMDGDRLTVSQISPGGIYS